MVDTKTMEKVKQAIPFLFNIGAKMTPYMLGGGLIFAFYKTMQKHNSNQLRSHISRYEKSLQIWLGPKLENYLMELKEKTLKTLTEHIEKILENTELTIQNNREQLMQELYLNDKCIDLIMQYCYISQAKSSSIVNRFTIYHEYRQCILNGEVETDNKNRIDFYFQTLKEQQIEVASERKIDSLVAFDKLVDDMTWPNVTLKELEDFLTEFLKRQDLQSEKEEYLCQNKLQFNEWSLLENKLFDKFQRKIVNDQYSQTDKLKFLKNKLFFNLLDKFENEEQLIRQASIHFQGEKELQQALNQYRVDQLLFNLGLQFQPLLLFEYD